jgi:hypothetical protein
MYIDPLLLNAFSDRELVINDNVAKKIKDNF